MLDHIPSFYDPIRAARARPIRALTESQAELVNKSANMLVYIDRALERASEKSRIIELAELRADNARTLFWANRLTARRGEPE